MQIMYIYIYTYICFTHILNMLHRFGFCCVFGLVCWIFLRNMSMTHLNVQYLVPRKTLSYSPPVGAATIRFEKITSI